MSRFSQMHLNTMTLWRSLLEQIHEEQLLMLRAIKSWNHLHADDLIESFTRIWFLEFLPHRKQCHIVHFFMYRIGARQQPKLVIMTNLNEFQSINTSIIMIEFTLDFIWEKDNSYLYHFTCSMVQLNQKHRQRTPEFFANSMYLREEIKNTICLLLKLIL